MNHNKKAYTDLTHLSLRLLLLLILLLKTTAVSAQLDETCQVTVAGQTVNVGFGGEYRLSNIPAGSNLVRLHAICTDSAQTRYGRSGFFQVVTNVEIFVSELDMQWSTMPFPTTSKILAVPAVPTLTQIGETTQITVTAFLSDSTQQDVTARAFGSTYTSSNTNIITVDQEGLVTAIGDGIGFVTVSNEGATATARINVSLGDPLTTVEGFVQLEDSTFVEGAEVMVLTIGGMDTTDATGHFSISWVITTLGPLSVSAKADTSGVNLSARVDNLVPVPGGITDAGIVMLGLSGIIHWWPGEEDAIDIVGGNNGTLIGGVTFTAGQVGQAFDLTAPGDFVEAMNPVIIPFGQDLTIAFWMRQIQVPPGGAGWIIEGRKNDFLGYHICAVADTAVVFGGRCDNATFAHHVFASIMSGQWQHVAAVVDWTAQEIRFYIDGIQSPDVGDLAAGPCNGFTQGDVFRIGAVNSFHSQTNFNGFVDEVQIFNRALTLAEIQGLL